MAIGSLNRRAMRLVQILMDEGPDLGVRVSELDDGSTIVNSKGGGYEVGRVIGEICMAGLGRVSLATTTILGTPVEEVHVDTDRPLEACLLSQLAGWSIKAGKFAAMGSGPARALAKIEEIFGEYEFDEHHREGVIVLETSAKVTTKASGLIASKCGIDPSDLYMVVTPTSSLAGAVQISARIVETGMHKMHTMGVDLRGVRNGAGSCPVPPVSKGNMQMMGRTNDAMLYGGIAHYVFEDAEHLLPRLAEVPASASKDYGRPFQEVFEAAGGDFYKIDPGLFSPGLVGINDRSSGRVFKAGRINHDVLVRSFGLS